jgi:transcription initiation factor IIE alpha subunit
LNNRTTLKQREKIRRIHIYYRIEQQASTKTKGEDQTGIYIYTIRLNSRTTPKQKGEDQTDTYKNTKGEDQTDKYIYYKIEQHDTSKAKGKDQTDKYIY